MEEVICVNDIVRLYCEGKAQDKYYLVLEISRDIEKEPPLYKLWCISTGEEAGWQYEFHTTSKLYRFKKVQRDEFQW